MEYFAAAAMEVDYHACAALDALDRRIAVVPHPNFRHEFCIVVREKSIVEGEVGRLLFQRRQAEREDAEARRCSAGRAGLGQPVANDVVESIDLVSKRMTVRAEQISVVQTGSVERPMFGPV